MRTKLDFDGLTMFVDLGILKNLQHFEAKHFGHPFCSLLLTNPLSGALRFGMIFRRRSIFEITW